MKTLVKDTIENIEVDVFDREGTITDIAPLSPKYDVRKRSGSSWLIQNGSCTTDGLTAFCLVDTTGPDWTSEVYQLFVYFDNAPEVPRIGPLSFEVAHAMPEVALGEETTSEIGVGTVVGFDVSASSALGPYSQGDSIAFDTVDFDTDGFATSTSLYTIPVGLDGTYLIVAEVVIAADATIVQPYAEVSVNGGGTYKAVCVNEIVAGSGSFFGSVTDIRNLISGDSLSVLADGELVTPPGVFNLVANLNRFTLIRLGDTPA